MINQKIVDAFLARKLDNHDWLKKLTRIEMFGHLADDLKVVPELNKLWLHQLVCFLLVTTLKRFMLHIDMGGGKALPDDEIVLTPKGWIAISKLRVGDKVIGSDGKPTKVLGVYPQGIKKINTVIFSDGASVRCCDDHLWAVTTPTRKWRGAPNNIKTTSELRKDLRDSNGWRKWFIPISQPVEFKTTLKTGDLDPYVLGAWLGDGTHNKPNITSGDPELIGDRKSNWLSDKLRELKVFKKKSPERFIPKKYLQSCISDRIKLLQGLMDADGYVTPQGKCYFASSSKQLADDFIYLVRSLGGTAHCKGFRPNDHAGHYNVYCVFPPNVMPCTLKRKVDRLNGSRRRKYSPTRAITSVARSGTASCTCIKVAAKDGLFVTKDFIVTHNTSITLHSMLWLKRKGVPLKGIVFVPYITAVDTWIQECKQHTPDLKLVPLLGTGVENKRLLAERNGDVYVACYATAVAMFSETIKGRKGKNKWELNVKEVKRLFEGFNFFVADEIHKCSDIRTLTYRMCRAISMECEYGIGLSGTPFGKDIEDIWAQFYLIDFGETLGATLGLFRQAFFRETRNFFSGFPDFKFNKKMMPQLRQLIKHVSIHYDAKEMHDLPDKRYIKKKLSLPDDIQGYVEIALAQFKDALHSKDQTERFRLAEASYTQLRQLASGYLAVGEAKTKVAFERNPKLDLLEEILGTSPPHSKHVVFHHFVYTNQLISDRLTKLKVGHARIWSGQKDVIGELARFRDDPKCRVLVLNDQSGSSSLNLQHANYMFFFEQPDSAINRQQGEKRIYRAGQKQICYFIDPFMDGTVDERIFYSNKAGKQLLDTLLKGKVDLNGSVDTRRKTR